jgi:ABC-type antimicrobial peptide transport system permease subunit
MVSQFSENTVVSGTAAVMAGKMVESKVHSTIMRYMEGFGDVVMAYMGRAFYVNEEKIASAFQFNMTEDDLRRLMEAMSGSTTESTAESNLKALGYADLSEPVSISLYFVDFEGKETFIRFLDEYNAKMEAAGMEEQIIRYTDLTGVVMSSVRTIIDSVSYVLIAFVSVSLIVSSIMIGIITYISVMERTKEIGVLRAIGASKRNISQVFNAETFIIGLCSGLIGVGVTLLLNIPINSIIHSLTNNPAINAQLPAGNALILIVLSMILTLIGGLIPSKQAAKKDPVIALRSE